MYDNEPLQAISLLAIFSIGFLIMILTESSNYTNFLGAFYIHFNYLSQGEFTIRNLTLF